MTFYIYRVWWTYSARNPITGSKSIKNPSCTWIPFGPIRPSVVPDRLQTLRPVRPLERTGQTGQHMLLLILVVNKKKRKLVHLCSFYRMAQWSRRPLSWLCLIVCFVKSRLICSPSNPKNTAPRGSVCQYLPDSFLLAVYHLSRPNGQAQSYNQNVRKC